jgi:rhomboid protease GluP
MFLESKTHLSKVIDLDSSLSPAYYYLALINLEEEDVKQAKVNAEKAVELNPNDKDFLNLAKNINQYLQSSGGGE